MTLSLSVAVMAHARRERFVAELLASLDRPAQVVWDSGKNDRWDTGRRAMLAFDPHATHHAVIQDDAIVCRDLLSGVERALRHVPDGSPLCLYAGRVRPFRDLVQRLVDRTTDATSWLTMGQIHWGVGIVLPTRWIADMLTWCDQRTDVDNYDKRISRWCQHMGLTVYYPWPSLVDHRESPSLVPRRTSVGRRAHRFIGADMSALERRWDGQVVSIPALGVRRTSAPGQIGGPPVKFVSLKYPNLHIPTIGVKFQLQQTPQGVVGVAEATTRGAIAHLQGPRMVKRGVYPADQVDLTGPKAAEASTGGQRGEPEPLTNGPAEAAAPEPTPEAPPDRPGDDGEVARLGGGWWAVTLEGEQVAKVRGEQAAVQRLNELRAEKAGGEEPVAADPVEIQPTSVVHQPASTEV